MLIYPNCKVQNLENTGKKALTFTLKNRNPTIPGSLHFFLLFWARSSHVVEGPTILLPTSHQLSVLFCFMQPNIGIYEFLCWKRGPFKAAYVITSAQGPEKSV